MDPETNAAPVELDRWRLLSDGRFRGVLPNGLVVEFEGEIVGPSDPGIVKGPGGERFLLGAVEGDQPAPAAKANGPAMSSTYSEGQEKGFGYTALVAAAAAVVTLIATLAGPAVLDQIRGALPQQQGPVTRTNVTIVETRKTLADGTEARVVDRTTRRERIAPGKAPVVSERTTRTEKVLRDQRVRSAPAPAPAALPPGGS